MKILSIGNSFSQDAQAYLHDAALSLGLDLECLNLYIGGCSLERHYNNLLSGERAYSPEYNGHAGEEAVSLGEVLEGDKYDVVTLQQASHYSGLYETYHPYIDELYKAVVKAQRNAKVYIHETWAYEIDSTHSAFPDYGSSQKKMFDMLHEAYGKVAGELGLDVIPVGSAVQYFRENVSEFDYAHGGKSLNRDGFHLSIPLGRLLSSLVWIEKITGRDVSGLTFVPAEASEEDKALIPVIAENVHSYMKISQK